MPLRSARTKPLRDGAVQPEDERVDRELHDRARPERAEVEDPAREVIEDGPRPFKIRGLATDHDRQLARKRGRDTARDRGVEDAGAARSNGRRDGPDRVGQDGAHIDRDHARSEARGDPVRPLEQVAHRRIIGDHRDDDVRPRRGLGGGGRHARADPPRQLAGPVRRPVVDHDRDALPGQSLGHGRAHPACAQDGGGRGGHRRRLVALMRHPPYAVARSRRSARPRAPRGPRALPPMAAGCAES